MSQPVVGHGQEEEVEGVGLAVARRKASLQGGDRLGVPTRSVLDDAQRVEVDVLGRGQVDGATGQIAVRDAGRGSIRDRWPAPRLGCCSTGPTARGWRVGLPCAQRGLQIGDRGLISFQEFVDRSAHAPIAGVVRPQADRLSQVVDCLREALQVGQGTGAMVVGIGVVGIALESRGVTLEPFCGGLGELLEMSGQRAEIDLERRQGGRRVAGGVVFGIGRRVPVEAHPGEVLADASAGPRRARPETDDPWWSPPAATRRG